MEEDKKKEWGRQGGEKREDKREGGMRRVGEGGEWEKEERGRRGEEERWASEGVSEG